MIVNRRKFLGLTIAGATYSVVPKYFSLPGKKLPSLKIAFLTDLHSYEDPKVEAAYEKLSLALENEKTDLVLFGGDWITEGNSLSVLEGRKRLERVNKFWSSVKGLKYSVPGNHDFIRPNEAATPDLSLYKSILRDAPVSAVYDLGEYKLITLESMEFKFADKEMPYTGKVTDIDWLKSELLKIDPLIPIILLLHIPLLTMYFQRTAGGVVGAPANRIVTNNIEVLNAFKNHNLSVVLQGHLHVSEFMKWGATSFITGGAICGKWWQGEHFGTPPGYGVVSLGSGGVEWEYRGI
jgi:Icc protein